MTPIRKQRSYLTQTFARTFAFPTMLIQYHDRGYADFKGLWLCMTSARESLTIYFSIVSYLNIVNEYINLDT